MSQSNVASAPTMHHAEIRSVDRDLLSIMRSGRAFGIGELTDALGVTATAIRQRVERLLESGLLEREKVVAGRGRPTFQYRLTLAGHRSAGANAGDLADAMWRTILDVEDEQLRQSLLAAVASNLGQKYAEAIRHASGQQEAVERLGSKMTGTVFLRSQFKHLSEVMSGQKIDAGVSEQADLPVLDINACPYPSLTEASDDRAMCKLEEQMLSEALGHPVHLSSCRLDGDDCCQFSPSRLVDEIAELEASTASGDNLG